MGVTSTQRIPGDTRIHGPNKARFDAIFNSDVREAGRLLRLASLPGVGMVGIATSKKIGGKPLRNRAKRRVREAIRTSGGTARNLDMVVIVNPSGAKAPFEALAAEWKDLLARTEVRWAEKLASS